MSTETADLHPLQIAAERAGEQYIAALGVLTTANKKYNKACNALNAKLEAVGEHDVIDDDTFAAIESARDANDDAQFETLDAAMNALRAAHETVHALKDILDAVYKHAGGVLELPLESTHAPPPKLQ